MNCKFCNCSKLEIVSDLGFVPIVNKFLNNDELNQPEIFYPLSIHSCTECNLVQLGFLISPSLLFNDNYPYDSRMTKKRRDCYLKLVNRINEKFNFEKNSLVIDIGSNTGLLLELFKMNDFRVLGIDASANVAKIANSKGIKTFVGFFDSGMVEKIITNEGKGQIIMATNVLAHIQDFILFINSLNNLINNEGIFVFQVPHLLKLLENLEYDTIYHEHVCYFSLKPLIRIFKTFGFEIFDIFEDDIDGGSIQCFVSKKGNYEISDNVNKILEKEELAGIYSSKRLQKFSKDVKNHKKELLNLLINLKTQNKKIVGIGAAAKGVVLMNYCKIDSDVLDFVTEKDPLKIGKFVPGVHIPIVSDELLLKEKPDYALILAWNFSEEIMMNLKEFKENGGKFIIPIPTPKIL